MKRAPLPGELSLVHATAQTGDVQEFAVCPENYDPAVIRTMKATPRDPLVGYRLVGGGELLDPGVHPLLEGEQVFVIVRADGTRLTLNLLRREGRRILLSTDILFPMPDYEAAMMADLEQCAALMLLGVDPAQEGEP